jgi:hypothetical protein
LLAGWLAGGGSSELYSRFLIIENLREGNSRRHFYTTETLERIYAPAIFGLPEELLGSRPRQAKVVMMLLYLSFLFLLSSRRGGHTA